MHKTKDFLIDASKLSLELLEEREWKRKALLDVLANDVFTNINFAQTMFDWSIALSWDLSSWKLIFSDPETGFKYESPIMFKHGQEDLIRPRRAIRLCCGHFTKMDAHNICFGSDFRMNRLEMLEDLIEFMLQNMIVYDISPLETREIKLWEKWSSLEEIYLLAKL